MKQNSRIIINIIWLVVGGILISLSFAGKVDEFWNGMGFGLVGVGFIKLLRLYRLYNNKDYREKMEIEESDERNHFIRNKSWAWTGYLFILTASVFIIIFKVMNQDLLSFVTSMAVCFMLLLYWICYTVLKRKY